MNDTLEISRPTTKLDEAPRSGAAGSPAAPLESLSISELAKLLECEAVIRAGLKTFVEVGRAFARIKASRLYKAKYPTFAAYCEAEWDMSDRRALQFEDAAVVVDELAGHKFLVLPETESQARPLLKLPRELWAPAWDEVVSTLHGKLTASQVAAVVTRWVDKLNGHGTEYLHKPEFPRSNIASADPVASDVENEHRANGAPSAAAIDLPDLSSKEKRIRAVAREAVLRLRELEELTGGYTAASGIRAAILDIDQLQEDVAGRERMLKSRGTEK